MSSSLELPARLAKEHGEKVIELIRSRCSKIEIVGSLRRGKEVVSDVDIVACPSGSKGALLAAIGNISPDAFVIHNKSVTMTTRQIKLSPAESPMFSIEIFLAAPDNYGWIQLLRTGDQHFTKFIVTHAPAIHVEFQDGPKRMNTDPRSVGPVWEAVPVPTEQDVFTLLKLPFINPADRTYDTINRLWKQPRRQG